VLAAAKALLDRAPGLDLESALHWEALTQGRPAGVLREAAAAVHRRLADPAEGRAAEGIRILDSLRERVVGWRRRNPPIAKGSHAQGEDHRDGHGSARLRGG
jgi:hypothetical protein